MAEFKIIKLTDMSPLHIGSGKENYDFAAAELQSDSISAALASIAVQTGRINPNDVKTFLESFRISSAFPYARNDHYYLPRMIGNFRVPQEQIIKKRKELKDIRYIYHSEDGNFWSKMIKGEKFDSIGSIFRKKDKTRLENNCKTQTNERVTITSDGTMPFFYEWTYFQKDGGLFCIVDTDGLFDTIRELFVELGLHGIGTDKSIGGGKFSVKDDVIDLPEVDNPNATMLLSTYIPQKIEIPKIGLENGARYELVCRGGFVSGSNNANNRHYRKNTVYMFNVGSVFTTTDKLYGEIVDLQPNSFEHHVWRSGRPFTINVKI